MKEAFFYLLAITLLILAAYAVGYGLKYLFGAFG